MIDSTNITKEEERYFLDVRSYLQLFFDYIMTIYEIKCESNQVKKGMNFISIFEKYVISKYDGFKNSDPVYVFNNMIGVFSLISGFYKLSLANDEMLKKIDDSYLKKIEDILNGMFVDKTYCNQFDNRQKIIYLRNAISHFENGRLYKILQNGDVEVKLDAVPSKDKSLKPFHVIFSIDDCHSIANHLYNGVYLYFIPSANIIKSNLYYKQSEEIANIFKEGFYYKGYTRFETKKELVEKVRKSFHPNPNNYTEKEQIRDLRGLVEKGIIDNKMFKYDDNQIQAFLSCIKRIHGLGLKEGPFCDPFDLAMRISDYNMYPHPACRLEEMRMLCKYTGLKIGNQKKSIKIIEKEWSEHVLKNPLAYMTGEDIFTIFPEFHAMTTMALYFYYVFGHMLTNERTITLDGKIYDLERIRNSFVHGTWFSYYDKNRLKDFYKDFKYALYDCNNGQKNEGKWNWKSPVMSFQEILKLSNKVVMMKTEEYEKKHSRHI